MLALPEVYWQHKNMIKKILLLATVMATFCAAFNARACCATQNGVRTCLSCADCTVCYCSDGSAMVVCPANGWTCDFYCSLG
jgi:hypothetical protein